jgi:hypothetical protein
MNSQLAEMLVNRERFILSISEAICAINAKRQHKKQATLGKAGEAIFRSPKNFSHDLETGTLMIKEISDVFSALGYKVSVVAEKLEK